MDNDFVAIIAIILFFALGLGLSGPTEWEDKSNRSKYVACVKSYGNNPNCN